MEKQLTNGNDPIQPVYTASGNPCDESDASYLEGRKVLTGLTKREFFAAQMLAAYTANHYMGAKKAEEKAKWAVEDADALIKELNKPS